MNSFLKEYSTFYDFLYKDKNYKKECSFIEEIFKKERLNVKSILDLGCGTGRHSILLSEKGYSVVGVDRSEFMLDIARKKTETSKNKISFLLADITDFSYRMKFDAIISMFGVVSYQTLNNDFAKLLKSTSKLLSKSGIFVFDCWYGPAVLSQKPGFRIKETDTKDHCKIIRITKPSLDEINNVVKIDFKILKISRDNLVNETNETHYMRYFFIQEIKYFLEIAGLECVSVCPFMHINETPTEKDWNITVVSRLKRR